MDYEKAYKEALESAKRIINYYKEHNRGDESAIEDLEIIFPELKESEDKRIKKELTKFLKNASGGFLDTTIQCKTFGKWAAWLEKQGEQKVPINDFKAKDWYVSEVDGNIHDMTYNPADKDEQNPIMNVPTREVILSIWDLGNEWKELTNGSISTEYGTQLDYIQKHWHESEYYLREKQGEKKSKEEIKSTQETLDNQYVGYVYILDYCSGRVIVVKYDTKETIETLFDRLGLKESQCQYMVSDKILSIEYINF